MKIKSSRKQNKTVTVLEISKSWLKVIQLEPYGGENRVSYLDAFEIAGLSEEDLVSKITEVRRKLKIDSDNLLLSTPHTMVITKNLNLPSVSPAEIEDMVDLQIGKQTPYSGDEIVKDHYLLGSHMEGYSKVLLVIAHRDLVQRYLRITEAAGLDLKKIGFSTEGFLEWGRFVCGEAISLDKAGILVEIDYNTVDFEVIAEGNLIFSRNFSLGSFKASASGEDWQNKFIEEITRSVYAYQNEVTDKELGKIVISATRFAKKRLNQDFLEEKIGLPVEIIDQLGQMDKSSQALAAYGEFSEKNLSFANLVGSALSFDRQLIDLVPREVKLERGLRERGKDVYRIGIILIFILLLLSGLFLTKVYDKENYLNQIEARLFEVEGEARKLEAMARKIELAKDRANLRDLSLNLIYHAHKAVPPEIHLSAMIFDGKEGLVLRGDAEHTSEVHRLVDELEKSDYFENVQIERTSEQLEEGREFISFEVFCLLDQQYRDISAHEL